MRLAEIIESDFDAIYDAEEAAVEIVYTAKVATAAVTINAFLQFESDLEEASSGLAAFAKVRIRAADIARPTAYDKFTVISDCPYSGATFEVLRILDGNKHSWALWAFADPRQIPSNLRGV